MDSSLTWLFVTLGLWAAGFLLRPTRQRCKGSAREAEPSEVSVIVPARNEEHNLPALLQSLATQTVKPREVIVVDDGSTDQTADLARKLGATVIPSQPVPNGWRGKTWACHQGAQAAKGELLLFLDADTWFERDGWKRTLAAYSAFASNAVPSPRFSFPAEEKSSPGGLPGFAFSVGPYHAVRRLHEDLSLFFNFNMTIGTVPDGLFGQMLLVDRTSYGRVGGHEVVKGRTLEHLFLAQQLRAAGVTTRSMTGRGILSFRMYPNGLRELIGGWTKGFASGAIQTPRGVLLLVIAWMIGLMLAPIGWLVTGDGGTWGAAYLACAMQVGWFSRQIGAFRWITALLYPVPLFFFFAVFARSARRSGKPVTWKGREIRAD